MIDKQLTEKLEKQLGKITIAKQNDTYYAISMTDNNVWEIQIENNDIKNVKQVRG